MLFVSCFMVESRIERLAHGMDQFGVRDEAWLKADRSEPREQGSDSTGCQLGPAEVRERTTLEKKYRTRVGDSDVEFSTIPRLRFGQPVAERSKLRGDLRGASPPHFRPHGPWARRGRESPTDSGDVGPSFEKHRDLDSAAHLREEARFRCGLLRRRHRKSSPEFGKDRAVLQTEEEVPSRAGWERTPLGTGP